MRWRFNGFHRLGRDEKPRRARVQPESHLNNAKNAMNKTKTFRSIFRMPVRSGHTIDVSVRCVLGQPSNC
jgi:hypothetical protein